MSEKIKMTDEEITEIRKLQEKFQQNIFQLGQNTIQKIQAEDVLKNVKIQAEDLLKNTTEQEIKLAESWLSLQKEENKITEKLLAKYGEGSLDLQSGTFISEKPST